MTTFHDMPDSNRQAEIDHDQPRKSHHEALLAEVVKVTAEIEAGDHDRELFESSYLDTGLIMRIARIAAQNGWRCGAGDTHDLSLQIADYASDLAERRLLRAKQ